MPGGTLLTIKCPAPGTHHETNARGLPGGNARGWNIDSQITSTSNLQFVVSIASQVEEKIASCNRALTIKLEYQRSLYTALHFFIRGVLGFNPLSTDGGGGGAETQWSRLFQPSRDIHVITIKPADCS